MSPIQQRRVWSNCHEHRTRKWVMEPPQSSSWVSTCCLVTEVIHVLSINWCLQLRQISSLSLHCTTAVNWCLNSCWFHSLCIYARQQVEKFLPWLSLFFSAIFTQQWSYLVTAKHFRRRWRSANRSVVWLMSIISRWGSATYYCTSPLNLNSVVPYPSVVPLRFHWIDKTLAWHGPLYLSLLFSPFPSPSP